MQVVIAILSMALLASCVASTANQKGFPHKSYVIDVVMNDFDSSDFKQVEANFISSKPKALVFRVLSAIDTTPLWLDRLNKIEVVDVYSNQSYLLRTVIDSPWPFKDRELISCVDTTFEKSVTTVKISSCSKRVTKSKDYVRIEKSESIWKLVDAKEGGTNISYKTWIDPEGFVPAFLFNRELKKYTQADLKRLSHLIEQSSLTKFSY